MLPHCLAKAYARGIALDNYSLVPVTDYIHHGLPRLSATAAFGVADFNWSSAVSTPCQRTWSFFVSIGSERSE